MSNNHIMSYPKITSGRYPLLIRYIKKPLNILSINFQLRFRLDISNFHTVSYPEMMICGYQILYVFNLYDWWGEGGYNNITYCIVLNLRRILIILYTIYIVYCICIMYIVYVYTTIYNN